MAVPMVLMGLPVNEIVPVFDASAGVPAGATFARGALFTADGLLCIAPNGTPATLNPDGIAFDAAGRMCTCTTGASVTSASAPFAFDPAGRLLVAPMDIPVVGYWGGVPYTAAGALPITPAIDATAEQIRSAMLDPASFASGGWRIPGTAGARIQASARASVAMQVRQDGAYEFAPHNLLMWSDDISNAAYSLSGGTATASRFTESATNAEHWFQQSNAVPSGAVCTYAIRLSAAGRTFVRLREVFATNATVIADLSAGSIVSQTNGGTGTITALGGGVFRVTLTFVSGATTAALRVNTLDAGQNAVYTGDGTSGVNVFRVMGALGAAITAEVPTTTAAVYAPAIDWLSGVGRYGVRSEEARTNLVASSAITIGANGWTNLNAPTFTPGQADIFGAARGTLITASGGADEAARLTVAFASSTTYTCYAIVTRGTARWARLRMLSVASGGTLAASGCWFDLQSGAVGTRGTGITSSAITALSGNRFLIELTATTEATIANPLLDVGHSNADNAVTTNAGQTMTVDHVQIEAGAFRTSPILTYGSAATRGADSVQVALAGAMLGMTECTLVADYVRPNVAAAATFPGVVAIRAGGDSTRIVSMYVPPGLQHRAMLLVRNTTTQAEFPLSASDSASLSRAACTFKASDFAGSWNGAAVASQAAGTFPASLDTMLLGLVDDRLNGWNTRIRVLPQRLPNATLQALTA